VTHEELLELLVATPSLYVPFSNYVFFFLLLNFKEIYLICKMLGMDTLVFIIIGEIIKSVLLLFLFLFKWSIITFLDDKDEGLLLVCLTEIRIT
jgi:hypothetical protein